MKITNIMAALFMILAIICLWSCNGRSSSDGEAITTSETDTAAVYESVKASVSDDAISADITISGTPNAAIEGKVGTLNGESGEWSYSVYANVIGEDGLLSFSVGIPEGAVEIEVSIDRSTVLNGEKVSEVAAMITSVTPIAPKPLIKAPVNSITKTLPSIGDVKVLAIFVDFPDQTYNRKALSVDRLREELFGEGKTAYPYESVSTWFERASYGLLHMSGDVYYYTCKNNMTYYENGNFEEFVMEIMRGLDDKIDFSEYDSDKDHIIDNISFTVPLDGASQERLDYWHANTKTWYVNTSFSVDRVKIRHYISTDVMPYAENLVFLKQKLIHEMGHCLGLPDFYKYVNTDDWHGLHGEAGYEKMDDYIGDFCSFSKLMLGWFREDEVQVYEGSGEQTFELSSISNEASCIVLPISNSLNGFRSEYFLIEFVTAENNNTDLLTNASRRNQSGIRVFHIQAETARMDWGNEFKYNNFSRYYMGDDKIRVIKLINDGRNLYRKGDTIEFGAFNFGGYDKRGNASIDTGYRIEIGELKDGRYTVTVTK